MFCANVGGHPREVFDELEMDSRAAKGALMVPDALMMLRRNQLKNRPTTACKQLRHYRMAREKPLELLEWSDFTQRFSFTGRPRACPPLERPFVVPVHVLRALRASTTGKQGPSTLLKKGLHPQECNPPWSQTPGSYV